MVTFLDNLFSFEPFCFLARNISADDKDSGTIKILRTVLKGEMCRAL